jgi:hypothetical protein
MPLKLTGPAQPVVRDQPQAKYTDENRPIGAKSILGGRQVVWAGPDWRWQSPKSFGKLKSSGKLNRSIFSDPLGVIGNELRYMGRQTQVTNQRAQQGPLRSVGQAVTRALPGVNVVNALPAVLGKTGRNLQAGLTVGAAENAAKLGIALTQKVRGRPANPENAGANSLVERISDAGYRVLGATPPGQQNQFERGLDAVARGTGAGIVGTAVAAKAIPAIGVGAAGAVVTGGLRLAAGEVLSTFFDDNRGGNLANLGEAVGRPLPLSVNVGEDDWIDSAVKSLIPNAIPGLALGGVGEAAGGFRNTRRWLKDRRTVSQVTDARTQLQQAGVTQTDPATGATAFKPTEPDPTGQQARINQFFEDIGETDQPQTVFGGLRGDQPATPARPPADAADAAPTTEAAPAPKADAEPAAVPAAGGELEVEGVEIDPFELIYDPELPEADVVFNLVRDLDDTDLQALLAQPGPVVPRIDELLMAREAMPVRPELEQGRVMAPAESVAERIGPDGQPMPYEQTLEAMNFDALRDVAAPENNPELSQLIGDITGRDFEQFTKADIIEGLAKYRERSGMALLVRDWQQSFRLTGEIQADPLRFQYKQGVNEVGEQRGNSLDGVDRWDTVAEGTLDVWTDPANNTTYVVNGHNRLARANQLGIPTLPTRELPAATAEEARALGALANIKEGRGTVFDAAKFMRDTGITSPEQLQRMGAPMTDGHAARGLALSQLPDNIFQAAVDGRLSVGKAAAIGGSGLDETQMQRAYKALSSGKDMSDAKFSEIVQQVRSAPVVEGSQVDLFGNTEAMSLMGQKADLVTAIRGDLLKEKRVFGTAARGAGRLEQGGNVINVENSRAIAADAGQVLGMFDRLKYAPGPVGELLNDGARQIAEGAKPKVIADRIRGQVAEAVRSAMDEQGLPGGRAVAGGPTIETDEASGFYEYNYGPFQAVGSTDEDGVLRGALAVSQFGQRGVDELPAEWLQKKGVTDPAKLSTVRQTTLLREFSTEQFDNIAPGEWLLDGWTRKHRSIYKKWFKDDPRFKEHEGMMVFTQPADSSPRGQQLTPEQRQAAQIEVIRRAVDEAEVRPPETPIPELPDGPALTPDAVRADIEAGRIEPGSPAAQALADEIRLTAEFAERDAQMRAIAEEGAKDAMGYELKTFEEKKALGMTDGYDPEPVMPTEVMPRDTGPSIADLFEQQAKALAQSDARLYRRAGEGLQRMRDGLDQLEDPALAPAPIRPEPLQLADDPPPEPTALIRFTPTQRAELESTNETLLGEMDWSLDGPMGKQQLEALERNIRIDYASPEAGGLDEVSPQVRRSMIGLADKMRKAIEGLDQQPQGGRPKPRSKKADQAARQQIQANEQRMAELRRKMQDEGCSL